MSAVLTDEITVFTQMQDHPNWRQPHNETCRPKET